MILHCTFEELSALRGGAERALETGAGGAPVVAPPEPLDALENLIPELVGDISVPNLGRQREIERALGVILGCARERMDSMVVTQYVGSEDAVVAYFEYSHILTVHHRLREIGAEMEALVELMTGLPHSSEAAQRIHFPD